MGNMEMGMGVLVVGNELNKVDTIKSLANSVAKVPGLASVIISDGVLEHVKNLAETVYHETVEMMGLYLGNYINSLPDSSIPDDEDEYEDEDEDEDDEEYYCDRCDNCYYDEDDGDYIDGEWVCQDCMTMREYRILND